MDNLSINDVRTSDATARLTTVLRWTRAGRLLSRTKSITLHMTLIQLSEQHLNDMLGVERMSTSHLTGRKVLQTRFGPARVLKTGTVCPGILEVIALPCAFCNSPFGTMQLRLFCQN